MGGLFSRPAPQQLPPSPPTPPPPMPDPQSAQTLEAARKKAAMGADSGRQSTMLSDAGGGLKSGGDYSSTKLGG